MGNLFQNLIGIHFKELACIILIGDRAGLLINLGKQHNICNINITDVKLFINNFCKEKIFRCQKKEKVNEYFPNHAAVEQDLL